MTYLIIKAVINDGNPPDAMNESFTLVGPFHSEDESRTFASREEFADRSVFPRIVGKTPLTPEEAIAALAREDDE